jgi:hypothetical protein
MAKSKSTRAVGRKSQPSAVELDVQAADTVNAALSEVIALLDLIGEGAGADLEDATLAYASMLGKARLREAREAATQLWNQARALAGHAPTVQP